MLATCIICFIVGILLLLVAIATIVVCIVDQDISTESGTVLIISGFGGAILLIAGIWNYVEGNKFYDKVIKIYSLQASDRFILGVGDGSYYYNLNDTDVQACIDNVPVVKTTLVQDDNIEYTYLLEHKVKWEKSEYFLYVPTNVRIIQYTIK